MAFDAGAIVARLDIDTAGASRKLDDFEKKADNAARDRHIRLDASFDDASIGKARTLFAQLDNQLSRDAASRLRSSPQGSVLGSLSALFSPHQIAGGVSPQQAASQGLLGQVAKQSAKALPGVEGSSTQTETVKEDVRARRSFLGGLLGGIFSGGGGGGGGTAGSAASGAARGGGSFLSKLLGGAGPGVLGLSGKLSAGIGIGGSLLGALPALGAVGAGVGVIGAGAGILFSGKNNPLAKQAKSDLSGITGELRSAAQPLVAPLLSAFKMVAGFIKQIGPELHSLFAGAAPLVKPLVQALEDLVKGLLPGLIKILDAARPAFTVFAKILGTLGKDIGGLFAAFAPAIRQSAPILKALFDLIGGLLPIVGHLAAIFAKALAPAFVAFAHVIKELEPILDLIGHVLASLAGAVLGDLVGAFTAVATLIKDIGPSLKVLAGVFSTLFNVLENSGVFAVLGDALETVAPLLAKLVNVLVEGLAPILGPLVQLIAQVANIGFKVLVSALQAVIPLLIILIQNGLQLILPLLQTLLPFVALLARFLGDVLVGAIKLLTPVLRIVIDIITFLDRLIIGNLLKAIDFLVKGITDLAGNWGQAWSDIKHWAEDAWQFITHGWGQWLVPGITLIRDAITFLRDHWKQIWGDITGIAEGAWHILDQDIWQPFEHLFTVDIPSWFKEGIAAVKQVWGDIEQIVLAPVNWIIQHPIDGLIHAFDWISSKVGGPNIAPLAPLQLSHGGRLGGFGGGDVVPALLEPGETVVDKHRSRQFAGLFAMMGVPGYKHGGGIFSDIGNFFGDLWHGAGILAALATGNFKAASSDFEKLLGGTGVGGAVGDFAALLTAIPHFLVSTAVHDLIGLFTSGGPGGGAGITGNVGSYRGLILRVLAMLGQPAADLLTVERQMTTESGGNPDAVNKWDSNWKAGHPSVGLMQVIQGTFDSYAGPFRNVGPFLYGVSTNPLANIFAGLNYALHAYGPGWTSVLGQGHGYDSGGWLKPGWALNLTAGREAVLTPTESDAFVKLGKYANQLAAAASGQGGVMRDVYFQLPEGATVNKALSELTFKMATITQEASVMTP